MTNLKSQHGFTLLELLIATTVFSVILLLITVGLINIGKSYYKGSNQARTQAVARNVIDEISRGIQFSGSDITTTTGIGGGKFYFCLNGATYAYIINSQLNATGKVLIAQDNATCASPITDVATANGRELLTQGMRLLELNVSESAPSVYTVTVSVGIGGNAGEFFDPANYPAHLDKTTCKTGSDGQFCTVSKLSTTVVQRIRL